jgi:hypothetical protein
LRAHACSAHRGAADKRLYEGTPPEGMVDAVQPEMSARSLTCRNPTAGAP